MFLDPAEASSSAEGVFGRDVAVDEWLVALLEHGRSPCYRFFQNRDRLNARPIPGHNLVERLSALRGDASISIDDLAEAPRILCESELRVWHDADGDLDMGIAMRRYARRIHPVTATSHVLSYRSLRHNYFLRLLLQKALPCDSLVCTSRAARIAAERLFDAVTERVANKHGVSCHFGGRLDVVPLGVDITRFQPRDKIETRRAIGLPERAFLITWVGRLSLNDKADLTPLITVFARLVKSNPRRELGLVIAGSGLPLAARMLRRHAERLDVRQWVHFIDPLDPRQRHLVHAAADVFVSPVDNVQETFGLTPLEAMASGVPQVVADWDGYRDTVVEGETGFLAPTYIADADVEANYWVGAVQGDDFVDHLLLAQSTALDLDAMEIALQRLYENEDLRRQMAEASRRRAITHYAWPKIISRYEALWTELAAIADTLAPDDCNDYALPSFFSSFSHYASSILTDDVSFRLSELGRRVISGEEELPLYLAATGLWSPDIFANTLVRLRQADKPLNFRALAGVECGLEAVLIDGLNEHRLRRHVMWLLKYGLIKLTSDV